MPGPRDETPERRDADAILDRVARDSDSLGGSAAARATVTPPSEEGDWAELWGRRIGRGLGYLAAVGLALWLLAAYFS